MRFEDIKTYSPVSGEGFFVDANVWYWVTYVSSKKIVLPNQPKKYQIDQYPDFIQRALDAGAKLYVTPFVFAELASIIERTEFEIYKAWGSSGQTSKKVFRGDSKQRVAVIREIESAWLQVKSLAECADIFIDGNFLDSCLNDLRGSELDGYDLFHLHTQLAHGCINLITDDKDFRTANGVKVFTTYE